MKKISEKADIGIWVIFMVSFVCFTFCRFEVGDFSLVSTRFLAAVGIGFLEALGLCLVLMAIRFVIVDFLIMKKEMKDDEQKKQKGA